MADATTQKVRGAKKRSRRVAARHDLGAALPAELGNGYGIARLARLIARDATRRVGEVLGLTLAEWRMLLVLRADEQAHLDELADRALLEKSHASIAATTLSAKKLVRRAASAEDRRRVLFSRTALGDRAVDTYLAATGNERDALWNVLTPAEQANLRQYLSRLLHAAEHVLSVSGATRPKHNRRVPR
ncbi:MAG: MarR family winged helix-turn-helix transcriptional regulator [Steroidobacteraceae bacterium]